MGNDRRIVIIGAGVAGLTTALELLGQGHTDITVLEQHGPGFGSSGKSAGVIETQYLDRGGIHVRDFGLRYFERFADDHGISLVRSGYLRYGGTDADMELFQRSLEIQREFGITDPVLLTPREVEERWPALVTDGRVGAVFGPSDGHIESYEFSLRAASVLVARDIPLLLGVALRGAVRDAGGAWTLQTSAGEVTADIVINAAGPWAKHVSEMFGAPMPLNNQLRPKVKMTHSEPLDPMVPFVMDYVPGSGRDGVYFRSEAPSEIFVGIHTDESIQEERDPDDVLGPAPQAFVDRVLDLLPTRLRMPEGLVLGRTWSGLYPISPDNRPIVGASRAATDVVHVMGAGGSGIQLAPAMGRMAAEIALTGKTTSFPDTDWGTARLGLA
ncbi:FAD-binding oxidoreductase [Cellulosimicrobium funkei]|nr:FAD-binding oxidoreductase [Cellulosimicrobium funkei]